MKKHSISMVYQKILKWVNHLNDNFTYAFDSLSGTELKVSLNDIFSVHPGCDSVSLTMMMKKMWLTEEASNRDYVIGYRLQKALGTQNLRPYLNPICLTL